MNSLRQAQFGKRLLLWLGLFASVLLLWPDPSYAYVGPGAGFAFVSSFFILLISFVLAFFTLLTWPFRWALSTYRSRKLLKGARVKKVIVLGLDGQDPELTEQFMKEGRLPNFKRLQEMGDYRRLGTSTPAESPVAWSCFQTGSNPGRHRIFDFFVPNRQTYLPELASAEIGTPTRSLRLGPYQIPLGKPQLQLKRKSQSFWKILGDHGIFSTILRVPISFPPESFKGTLLSAMSVPDLNGTQGTFSYYTSDPEEVQRFTGGTVIPVERKNATVRGEVQGPESPVRRRPTPMTIPFEVHCNGSQSAQLEIEGKKYALDRNEYTPWIRLHFKAGLGMKVRGLVRFYLKETSPHFKLYMSPINIDPQKPALPISHPFTYGIYLAKKQGDFCTLGLAEDTWALNERVLDESAFLKQAWEIHEEREEMFFDALEKTNRGLVVCVFDITDRLQHMFWRYQEEEHPANEGKDVKEHRGAIRELYRKMDDLVGRVLEKVDDETLLFVMSDHGFKSFQRGVNLNAWLRREGLLQLQEGVERGEWFQGVDWKKTRAFAMGLGGIYLNVKGRESLGVVEEDEIPSLKKKIREGLLSLRDSDRNEAPLREVYDTREIYSGPYVGEAPDLIAGFRPGYRVSWGSAMGLVEGEVIEDNTRSWSGDHCVNPPDVPGILFSNQSIEKSDPEIIDLGPTILDQFGVMVPPFVDGEPLLSTERHEG